MQCLNLLRRQSHSGRIGNDLQRPIAIMAKATSIKEALGRFEKEAGITAAETEMVRRAWQSLGSTVANGLLNACSLQVDLTAQVPSIEKMDGSLSILKACRYAPSNTDFIHCCSVKSGTHDALSPYAGT